MIGRDQVIRVFGLTEIFPFWGMPYVDLDLQNDNQLVDMKIDDIDDGWTFQFPFVFCGMDQTLIRFE